MINNAVNTVDRFVMEVQPLDLPDPFGTGEDVGGKSLTTIKFVS